jgi:hypothetical protein
MIINYIDKIKSDIENYQIIEKSYSEERGFTEGELFFIEECRLDFTEVKDIEVAGKLKYYYHYMDRNNSIIFHYDNALHHKEIKIFPLHKHLSNTIKESNEPELKQILNEIEHIVVKK